MNIGILSKRTGYLAGKLKDFYESSGHCVKIYTKENLCIDKSLFENDFYILKSKQLIPFIHAGYYLEANNIPVIPGPDISYKNKNRLMAYLLIKNIGLLYPQWFYGTRNTILENLSENDFPLIVKPIIGSGSKGVKIIKSINDIEAIDSQMLYFERFLEGTHYTVYFIDEEICVMEKIPLKNEHSEMNRSNTTKEMRKLINKWKSSYKLLFGHLDIVKEKYSEKLYIVDAGSFPVFTNWKCGGDYVSKIGNLILDEYKKLKSKKQV